ncbi:PucR family transcriptional regulator [Emergencia timonensis]|uniref:PucR family transcriptional regulator n=1 Tax=Emergencia timonensis TaxID=1776384 RepID=UPI003984021F
MVTCRQLMELDIFHNVKLKAGRKGLDRAVSWVYAKHTKTITEWVHGREFILVSGYEYGIDEAELLKLIEEAAQNNLSGILVEGGINFKEMPASVIKKADEKELPLFFVRGVISFLDVPHDVLALIMENRYLKIQNVSLLDKLLNAASLSQKEVDNLFCGTGISPDSYFMLAVFNINTLDTLSKRQTTDRADVLIGVARILEKHISSLFEQMGKSTIYKVNLDSVDYLLYADTEEELMEVADALSQINANVNAEHHDYDIYLSFSSILSESRNVLNGLNEAYFTGNLLNKKIFAETSKHFSDIGSYQILFYTEDKAKLLVFRDRYLKKLYEADLEGTSQLMETLHTFLLQGGNMMQTSKTLFIHRNTLQYRLERIETITGRNINGYQARRDFVNAFLIHDLFPYPEVL